MKFINTFVSFSLHRYLSITMGGQNIIITFVHYYKVCLKKKQFVSHDSHENVRID